MHFRMVVYTAGQYAMYIALLQIRTRKGDLMRDDMIFEQLFEDTLADRGEEEQL